MMAVGLVVADCALLSSIISRGALAQFEALRICGNKIGNAGPQALALLGVWGAARAHAARAHNNNEIGCAGAQALALSFGALPQLTSLNLFANQIGDAGGRR